MYIGGAVSIGLDQDGLDEYVRLNPSVDTVDEFTKRLVASGFFPDDIVQRCEIAASILETGNMHMVLKNVLENETACYMFAERIADMINNPPSSSGNSTVAIAYPQVFIIDNVSDINPIPLICFRFFSLLLWLRVLLRLSRLR